MTAKSRVAIWSDGACSGNPGPGGWGAVLIWNGHEKELKGGADFAKLAEQKSKDASAKSGGDLGWFTLDTMVKEFGDAVVKMQPGATSEPVHSQFGWHVIKLEESRSANAPEFEAVKDRVKMLVQRKKLQAYLDELRKGAKIEKKI